MILLALGSFILIGGIVGALGIRQYRMSNRRQGTILIFGGAGLCLLSLVTYLSMILLTAGGM